MAGAQGVKVALGLLSLATGAWAASTERLWVEAASIQKERSTLVEVARRAMPAVVSITTQPTAAALARGGTDAQQGIGSGFIIHPEGYILTSAHVVEGAGEVRITLLTPEGHPEEAVARVVGHDVRTDTALLKVDVGRKLPTLPLGSGNDLQLADWVVVIGNPFGLSHSVSVGVVSFQGRTDVTPAGRDGDFDYIQTDASINPGNSGGPVLDLNGHVVAMANAVNVSGQGIGFAIPIDIAKSVLPHLKRYGQVRRGWMGITVQDLTPSLGVSLGIEEQHGVVVSDVTDGSPGARAGLRVGDVITEVDTVPIPRAHVLRWRVSTRGAGRTVELAVRRHGRPLRVRVTLEAMEGVGHAAAMEPSSEPSSLMLFGATLEGSPDVDRGGARVKRVLPGSPFFDAGLLPGDVVLQLGEHEVLGGRGLADTLKKVPGGSTVHLSVRRGTTVLKLPFRKP